ncbi:unnamed protein product [Clonostachys solani]|uniref:Uncharacterized protein n=1 Tax=Clonostachys solani TaxID=160281 RepID=A0A9N9YVN8_9HYPO|nr:unnamed protein product [Clonostachys solani]
MIPGQYFELINFGFGQSMTMWVDGFVEYLNKQADAGGVQSQPASAEEMMKVMVDYCIGSYERRRQPAESGHEHHDKPVEQFTNSDRENNDNSEQKSIDFEHKGHDKQDKAKNHHQKHLLSIRQRFSQYINYVGIQETTLFNKFNELVEIQQKSTSGIIKLRDEIFKAHKLFIDVKDIRDELNILKSIAKYQEIVQEKMLGKKHCAELNLPASYVVNDIAEMDKLVERIQSAQSEIASLQADEAYYTNKRNNDFNSILVADVISLIAICVGY